MSGADWLRPSAEGQTGGGTLRPRDEAPEHLQPPPFLLPGLKHERWALSNGPERLLQEETNSGSAPQEHSEY